MVNRRANGETSWSRCRTSCHSLGPQGKTRLLDKCFTRASWLIQREYSGNTPLHVEVQVELSGTIADFSSTKQCGRGRLYSCRAISAAPSCDIYLKNHALLNASTQTGGFLQWKCYSKNGPIRRVKVMLCSTIRYAQHGKGFADHP